MKAVLFLISSLIFSLTVSAQTGRRETARGFSQTEIVSMTLSNSAAETNLYSYTIPARKLGDTKEMNFRVLMVMNSALSVPSLTIKVKFGTSTLTLLSGAGVALSLNNRPLIIEGVLVNTSPTTQRVAVWVMQSGVLSGFNGTPSEYAEWTIDTTQDQPFAITAQFGGLSVSTSLAVKHISIDAS